MSAVTRIRTQESITVPYARDQVWAVLCDVARYSEWWPARFRVKILEGATQLIGTEFEVRPLLGRTFDCRVEETEEPRRMRIRFFGGALEGPCYLVIDALNGGATRLQCDIDVLARGFTTAMLSFVFPLGWIHAFQLRAVLAGLRVQLRRQRKAAERRLPLGALSAPVPESKGNLDVARAFIDTLSSSSDPADLTRHLAPSVTAEEFPNALRPMGAVRDLRGILEARSRSLARWGTERFDVWDATEGGSQVALELGWSAIAACETGLVPKGQRAEARIALFIKFKNQKIARLRTYLAIAAAGSPDLAWPETEGSAMTSLALNDADPSNQPRGTNAGSNFDIARLYLAALSEGQGPEAIARFFSTDAVCEVLPSALNPRGERWDLRGIKAARESSLARFAAQEYELRGAAGGGSNVAMEVHWTGRLGIACGTHTRGQTLQARSAVFLRFRDGLIVRQRNYDAVGTILIAPESTAAVP